MMRSRASRRPAPPRHATTLPRRPAQPRTQRGPCRPSAFFGLSHGHRVGCGAAGGVRITARHGHAAPGAGEEVPGCGPQEQIAALDLATLSLSVLWPSLILRETAQPGGGLRLGRVNIKRVADHEASRVLRRGEQWRKAGQAITAWQQVCHDAQERHIITPSAIWQDGCTGKSLIILTRTFECPTTCFERNSSPSPLPRCLQSGQRGRDPSRLLPRTPIIHMRGGGMRGRVHHTPATCHAVVTMWSKLSYCIEEEEGEEENTCDIYRYQG
ncbi:hypothetical protein E2C01_003296 [Portunus trituberculatus]|uniref:Uncharacterized protein n=1 Tax=Portunus trituberculatus TaxID=210409 RepID=A0A5B7CM14_PORTR|nr:hypothetical protein [Portunus trituberculatus]